MDAMQQARQGDVYFTRVIEAPAGRAVVPEQGRLILARGEVTGHHHSVPASAGTLLQLPGLPDDDEPLMLVRVTNSTPEPDGQYKDYILRVPPTMTSAREAERPRHGLARPEDYAPAVQT